MLTVLCGGVGGAKLVAGIAAVLADPSALTVIVNTGDDWQHLGLHISPDVDTVLYTLAGLAGRERGWGIEADTWAALEMLGRYGVPTWFQLGDRDLATHLYRTGRLSRGVPLHQVTAELAERFGVRSRILPMSDDPVETRLKTAAGDLHFQEYFVREHWRPLVREIYWTGIEAARPAPGIAEAVAAARAVLIAPSNPAISIGPILRVPGVRRLLTAVRGRTVAISPLIQGRAVKGPTVELMRAEGIRPDALGVAQLYRDLAAGFVLDAADAALAPAIAAMGYRVAVRPTLLDDIAAAREVAVAALDLLRQPAAA